MIKKLVTIAALAMLLGSPASYAGFITGNSLANDCEKNDSMFQDGFCYGYVLGVYDSNPGDLICAPNGVTGKQLLSIVRKFFRERPEILHDEAAVLVTVALAEAFPCSD